MKGVFAGQSFGINNSWSGKSSISFHTRDTVSDLLKDLDVIKLHEVEKDGATVGGAQKHWHVFHVIARKR